MKKLLKNVSGEDFYNLSTKDKFRAIYFICSFAMVCCIVEAPLWALLLFVTNFILSIISLKKVKFNDN